VAVLWPGNSRIGPLCYPFETNNADDSAVELSKFIQLYLSVGPRISFISHSLGARVVLQTIEQLRIMGIAVDQVCLMAAAVDDDCLASSQYRAAVQYANRVAVLYSPCDKVLRYAYPPGNLLSSFMHWTATTDAALGYTGPKAAPAPNGDIPSQVWPSAIPQADGVNHGDYLPPPAGQPSISQLRAASYSSRVVASAPSPAYGASD
jgi:esterase/lipase superfamily enzyme